MTCSWLFPERSRASTFVQLGLCEGSEDSCFDFFGFGVDLCFPSFRFAALLGPGLDSTQVRGGDVVPRRRRRMQNAVGAIESSVYITFPKVIAIETKILEI